MMKTQGTDMTKKGAAPGAVVTVNCDYLAVSHAIRFVDFIYEVSKFGGARIATIAGILSTGTRKTRWWIPTDQYALKYSANEVANITPDLMLIREAILAKCCFTKKHNFGFLGVVYFFSILLPFLHCFVTKVHRSQEWDNDVWIYTLP
jgi:hypothetical protein